MGCKFNLSQLELEGSPLEPKSEEVSSQEEAIAFSLKIFDALSSKTETHNLENENKVTVTELREVYARGAEIDGCNDKGLEALARVNMFLRIKSGDSEYLLKDEFETDSEDLDLTLGWLPSEKDYCKAREEITQSGLEYNFSNIEELYVDNYKQIEWEW